MDCAKAKENLHAYIDGELSPYLRQELEQHLLCCEDCASELKGLRALSSSLRSLPEAEVPAAFERSLHAALTAEPAPQRPPLMQRGWAKGLVAAAMLVLVIGIFTLGGNILDGALSQGDDPLMLRESGSGSNANAPAPAPAAAPSSSFYSTTALPQEAEPAYDMELSEGYGGADDSALIIPDSLAKTYDVSGESGADSGGKQIEQKVIKDVSLSLRVDNFSAAYQKLAALAENYGGYVLSSDAYGYDGQNMKNGYINLRVDATRLDEALAAIKYLGKVENESSYTQDVTMTYYDIAGRLSQYQLQEQRLLEIMAKSETVEDLLAVERELTRVRAELESLTGQLRYYDQMTALSSINISLYQPDDATQKVQLNGWPGLLQDIRDGIIFGVNWLLSSLAALVVGFSRLLPLLLLLAVVILALILIIRGRSRK